MHHEHASDCYWREVLRRVLCCDHVREVVRVVTYQFKGVSFTAKGEHMSLTVQDTQVPGTATVNVAFVDAKGKPAKVDGVPVWVASDPTIVDTLTVAADGMSATIHITDTVGASQLTVTADVDLGPGITSTDFVDTVSVIGGTAVAANFTFGTVTPDP
jgi:hypothetical protein